jgi:hypothetical protein
MFLVCDPGRDTIGRCATARAGATLCALLARSEAALTISTGRPAMVCSPRQTAFARTARLPHAPSQATSGRSATAPWPPRTRSARRAGQAAARASTSRAAARPRAAPCCRAIYASPASSRASLASACPGHAMVEERQTCGASIAPLHAPRESTCRCNALELLLR